MREKGQQRKDGDQLELHLLPAVGHLLRQRMKP
jgi:hypothetical protein